MNITIRQERLVTHKEWVVTDEVRISHLARSTRPRNHLYLNKEEILVERFDPESGQWRVAEDQEAAAPARYPSLS